MKYKEFVVVLENKEGDRANLRFGGNTTVNDISDVMDEESEDLIKKSAYNLVGIRRIGIVQSDTKKGLNKLISKMYSI